MQYAGADWVKLSLKVKDMSPLGESVADLLGCVFLGIYHLPSSSLRRVDWSNKEYIEYHLHWHGLATVDSRELTALVVLAHDRMLRIDITALAPHLLKLCFWQRKREGGGSVRCPTMEDHIKTIRESV